MASISLRTDSRHGLMLVWRKGLQRWLTRSSFDEILPNLFLGGSYAAENLTLLSSKNVSFVLTIMSQDLSPEIIEQYNEKGIEHLFVQKRDESDENVLEDFGELCKVIEGRLQSGKTVLVHCAMGISRSATIVMAYGESFWVLIRCLVKPSPPH